MNDFVNYVAYNQYGGVDKSIPRSVLESWLLMYENNPYHLVLGIWELRRSEIDPEAIEVRLAPQFEIDQKDNNWRSWNYTFYPYRI